jgi:NAD(P)H-nitrite reductase large subunit
MLEDIAAQANIELRHEQRMALRQKKLQAACAVARYRSFQRNLAKIFRWPSDKVSVIGDDTVVCRCEGVSAGEIRKSITQQVGPVEVNRVKAITRCGMGRCQGRFCGLALAEITSQATGLKIEEVGRLRAQAPVKPLNVAAATLVSST